MADPLAAAEHRPGTVDLAVLQQLYAANHFEVIGRFSSGAAYEAHLVSRANLDYRRGVASALAPDRRPSSPPVRRRVDDPVGYPPRNRRGE
jgi:hypothetical protein